MTAVLKDEDAALVETQPAPSPPLLLVFGMPRSGTTWLGKIFDSHPDTDYLHEPDTRFPLTGIPLALDAGEAEAYAGRIRAFAQSLPHLSSARVRGKFPLFGKSYRSASGSALYRLAAMGAKGLARVVGDAPLPPAGRAPVTVWKSIESAGRLPALVAALPEVRAVYLVRHPCGYVASVLRGERERRFPGGVRSEDDVGVYEQMVRSHTAHRLGVTVEKIMAESPAGRLAWRWLLFNEHVLEEIGANAMVHILRYEDLCERPLETAQSLFRFAGLGWQAQSEAFIAASSSGGQGDYYGVYKDSRHSAWRWREELAQADRTAIETVVKGTCAGRLYALG